MPINGTVTWTQWNKVWPTGKLWQSYVEADMHAINDERYEGKRLVVGIHKPGGPVEMYGLIPSNTFHEIKEQKQNPGPGWFSRCMEGVSRSGSAVDPGAVCGAELKRMGYKRRNPIKPRGFKTESSGTLWYKEFKTYKAAKRKETQLLAQGYRALVNTMGGKWRVRVGMDDPEGYSPADYFVRNSRSRRRRSNSSQIFAYRVRSESGQILSGPHKYDITAQKKARQLAKKTGQRMKVEVAWHYASGNEGWKDAFPGHWFEPPASRKNSRRRSRNPWNISAIKSANRQAGYHFFDPESMRFFNSKVYPTVYEGPDGIYFVTHEIFESSDRVTVEKQFKVRQFDPANGKVTTHGPYLRSLQEAKDMARSLSGKRKKNAGPHSIRKTKKRMSAADLEAYRESGTTPYSQPMRKRYKARKRTEMALRGPGGARKFRRRQVKSWKRFRESSGLSSNPGRRFTLRKAGREFTVLAKSMRAAWREVNAYLKKEMKKLNPSPKRSKRLPAGWRAYQQESGYWYAKWMGYETGPFKTKAKAESFMKRQQAAAKTAYGNPRHRRRNRSVSMLVPRARRRTIRSVERRTSAALSKYLGGRRRY